MVTEMSWDSATMVSTVVFEGIRILVASDGSWRILLKATLAAPPASKKPAPLAIDTHLPLFMGETPRKHDVS